jgi:hypothetical protein
MAVTGVTHSYDGPKWTVNQLVKQPTWVPNIVAKMVQDSNIAEWLLRTGPTAVGGAVAYEETMALYAGSEGEIVAEFGEYPMTETSMRTPVTRATTKRGVGMRISEEMRTRNDVGRVQDEMRMVRDTLVNGRDKVFFDAILANPNVHSTPAAAVSGTPSDATNGWYSPVAANSKIKEDVSRAIFRIASQGVTGAQYSEKLGYRADTLIIHPQVASMLLFSPEVAEVFEKELPASSTISFTGLMPKKFLTLDVFTSWRCPSNLAIVCQRKAMGFISKEWPLRGTPLKFNEADDTYTSYFRYRDLLAVDNPKAVAKITNIDGSGDVVWT